MLSPLRNLSSVSAILEAPLELTFLQSVVGRPEDVPEYQGYPAKGRPLSRDFIPGNKKSQWAKSCE
jgi:hypothetical protein